MPRHMTMFPGGESLARQWKRLTGLLAVFYHSIEEINFRMGECQLWFGIWTCAIEHGQPKNAPVDDAEDRDRVGESVRGAKSRLLGFASGFQNFMKCFNFPAHGIPIEFFN